MAYFSIWRPHGNRVLETRFTTFIYLKLEPRTSKNIEKNPRKKKKNQKQREKIKTQRETQAARDALACVRPRSHVRPRPHTVRDPLRDPCSFRLDLNLNLSLSLSLSLSLFLSLSLSLCCFLAAVKALNETCTRDFDLKLFLKFFCL